MVYVCSRTKVFCAQEKFHLVMRKLKLCSDLLEQEYER